MMPCRKDQGAATNHPPHMRVLRIWCRRNVWRTKNLAVNHIRQPFWSYLFFFAPIGLSSNRELIAKRNVSSTSTVDTRDAEADLIPPGPTRDSEVG
jgi:hypothetical protein